MAQATATTSTLATVFVSACVCVTGAREMHIRGLDNGISVGAAIAERINARPSHRVAIACLGPVLGLISQLINNLHVPR